MPELGRLSRKQIAALAGLSRRARDSGLVKGTRTVFRWPKVGANGVVHGVGCVASLQPRAQSLLRPTRACGKPAKVALIAVARKLLTIANAIVRDLQPWSLTKTATQA